SGFGGYTYYFGADSTYTYSFQLTVTVDNKDLAQKAQDYLVSTTPTGTVTPQANFSETKRKQLEAQARDEATKDARAKADQSAKNLGFKVGKVKSVEDGTDTGRIVPLGASAPTESVATDNKLAVQPGQNDLNYSVTVVYFVH